jgi:hypothetical protein
MFIAWHAVFIGGALVTLCIAVPGKTPGLSRHGFDMDSCDHCPEGMAYQGFLKNESTDDKTPHSDVHMLWSTHVEIVSTTSDNGGWEPPSFHKKLAREAIRGWKRFRDNIAPGLPRGHSLRNFMYQKHAGALNDGFFHWQKRLFEAEGDFEESLKPDPEGGTPPPEANSSWPEMNVLPEYRRLRKYVEALSRKYLERSGMSSKQVRDLNYSLFNWAAVHGPGEFHGPHTHVGEYHVGVFYAQTGPAAGKLRFGDPRGHSPPFGRTYFHTPKSGDLVFFPSWLSHMATVTAPTSDIINTAGKEPYRVVFSFNVGPVQGPLPCHLWWSDPTGDMRLQRRSKIDVEALKVL